MKTWKIVATLGAIAVLIAPLPASAQRFGNDRVSCDRYGAFAVAEILRAQSKGCDVRKAREVLEPGFHAAWCRRQSPARMSIAANIHRTGVAHRCALQGVQL